MSLSLSDLNFTNECLKTVVEKYSHLKPEDHLYFALTIVGGKENTYKVSDRPWMPLSDGCYKTVGNTHTITTDASDNFRLYPFEIRLDNLAEIVTERIIAEDRRRAEQDEADSDLDKVASDTKAIAQLIVSTGIGINGLLDEINQMRLEGFTSDAIEEEMDGITYASF